MPTPSTMPSAARTARSGSSSCANGTPNAAITASPANFWTMPPWVVMQCVTWSKKRVQARADDLGIGARDELRRADEVDEKDRGELALHP